MYLRWHFPDTDVMLMTHDGRAPGNLTGILTGSFARLPGGYGVIAMANMPSPTVMCGPAVPVAVRIGVTVRPR